MVLPDQQVIDQLELRGAVFRTDDTDDTCPQAQAKIGPHGDGKPGGCDNIEVTIDTAGRLTADYWRGAD